MQQSNKAIKMSTSKAKKKDDILVDYENENKWAIDYFPCPLHNQNRVIDENTIKHYGNKVKNCSIC